MFIMMSQRIFITALLYGMLPKPIAHLLQRKKLVAMNLVHADQGRNSKNVIGGRDFIFKKLLR